MKPLVLLDLDRTIFDSNTFWHDFAAAFSSLTGIDKQEMIDGYENFIKDSSILRYVDFDDLLTKYNIKDKELIYRLDEFAGDKNYLYEDALLFLKDRKIFVDKMDFAILTFGQEKFQSLKLRYCEKTLNLPTYITMLPKAQFIKSYFFDRKGYLIDDKPGQNLPKDWQEVNIDRSKNLNKPKKIGDNLIQISDLMQIPLLLSEL